MSDKPIHVVTAPDELATNTPSVFLAGGISGCSDWQTDILRLLKGGYYVYNPRREQYRAGVTPDPDGTDPVMREQIAWEHKYLEGCHLAAFWFPPETLCPITLFELGTFCYPDPEGYPYQDLLVGAHPDYQRRGDLIVQLGLRRPEVELVDSIEALADQINSWANIGLIGWTLNGTTDS